mmetsp:Transcript_2417/g.7076  ORF Transcript_2417/g.7076 Transcript_2417/m.7076 type:complete len:220 (+) Transcript_2417:79-738(+)
MSAPKVHGTSQFLQPQPAGFVAAAEFMDFAPAPNLLCGCLAGEAQKKRLYAHVYENRLELSKPIAPYFCLTNELCMQDCIIVNYFDKPPMRSGLAPCPFCCFPCTCCGPPVVFLNKPKCCCLDCTWFFGEMIMAAPCNLYGCKVCLCCGNPCYASCAIPIMGGIENGAPFLSALKFAVNQYRDRNGLPESQMAIFEQVEDNIFDFGKAKGIQEMQMARQ